MRDTLGVTYPPRYARRSDPIHSRRTTGAGRTRCADCILDSELYRHRVAPNLLVCINDNNQAANHINTALYQSLCNNNNNTTRIDIPVAVPASVGRKRHWVFINKQVKCNVEKDQLRDPKTRADHTANRNPNYHVYELQITNNHHSKYKNNTYHQPGWHAINQETNNKLADASHRDRITDSATIPFVVVR